MFDSRWLHDHGAWKYWDGDNVNPVTAINFMSAAENITAKKLADLGVTEPDQLAPLFAQVRSRCDDESTRVHDEESWKVFRDVWLGRKSGVLTQITDNWLKPAPPALKPAVGAALNQLRAHVEPKIEALHSSIDSRSYSPGWFAAFNSAGLPGN
jgi:Aminoacyl tRNA synthetase class II, N-terminal domain